MAHDGRGRRRGGAGAASTASADTLRFPLAGSGAGPRAGTTAGARGDAAAVVFPLSVAAVHWLVVHLVASVAYRSGTPNPIVSPAYQIVPPPLAGLAHVLVEPLRQWDGTWYKLIAEEGYTGFGQAKFQAAFWPLYPWLMDYGSRLTGWTVDTVGFLVGHVAFAGALILLYRLIAVDFNEAVARRTTVALALFPTAFFFSAVYTESLFLLLVVGALLAARLGRWWVAGGVGLLAAMTRSYGVLLLLPFAVLFLQQYRLELRRWFPNGIALALPALGPAIFAYHLRSAIAEPLAFFTAQKGWDRYDRMPWETLRCGVVGCFNVNDDPDGVTVDWFRMLLDGPSWETVTSSSFRFAAAQSDVLELVCTLLFLALAVVGLRALPLYHSAYVFPALIIPLFQPSQVHALMSIPRFGLALFPLFVVLALLVPRRLAPLALGLSTALLVLFTAQFVDWYWVS